MGSFAITPSVQSPKAYDTVNLTGPLIAKRVRPQATAETTASATVTDNSYEILHAKRYGALPASSTVTNKAKLQLAIAAASAIGTGQVINPYDCAIGHKVTDRTTWPDFSACTAPVALTDYSQGASYAGFPTAYDGSQIRNWLSTPQTTVALTFTAGIAGAATSATLSANWTDVTGPFKVTFSNGDVRAVTFTNGATTATWTGGLSGAATANFTYIKAGQHDGNTWWLRAEWAPNICISNDANLSGQRYTSDNRRASYTIFNEGAGTWRIGQGTLSSATATSEQLSNFVIEKYSATGDTLGGFNAALCERATGNWIFGGATNSPSANYHFKSVTSGIINHLIEGLTTTVYSLLRTSNGATDDAGMRNVSGALSLYIDSQGDALIVAKSNRRATWQKSVVEQKVVITYSASMVLDASLGNDFEVTITNGTAFTMAAPTNLADGQFITITFFNASGGAAGVCTFNGLYRLVGGATGMTMPANLNNRSIQFKTRGGNLIEVSRTSGDVLT